MIVYVCDQCGTSEVLRSGLKLMQWDQDDEGDDDGGHSPDDPPLIIPNGWEPCTMTKSDPVIQRTMCAKCIAEDDSDA